MSVSDMLEPAGTLAQGLMDLLVVVGLIAVTIYVIGGLVGGLVKEKLENR